MCIECRPGISPRTFICRLSQLLKAMAGLRWRWVKPAPRPGGTPYPLVPWMCNESGSYTPYGDKGCEICQSVN